MTGKVYEVLVEGTNPKYDNVVCGRTESGRLVNFAGDTSLIGQFVNVKIEKSASATLWGVITTEEK
jgi:tRNA-2-methylthio-N6-dimethylallyladenosine synthase